MCKQACSYVFIPEKYIKAHIILMYYFQLVLPHCIIMVKGLFSFSCLQVHVYVIFRKIVRHAVGSLATEPYCKDQIAHTNSYGLSSLCTFLIVFIFEDTALQMYPVLEVNAEEGGGH